MNNNLRHPRPSAQRGRTWTPPKLTRLEAGRAELTVGPNLDNSNNS
jgi:hypothetical protein